MQVFTVLNKVRGLNKTILLKWNNSKDLLFCWKTGFWSNIPFNTSPNANLNLRTFLFVRRDHIVDPRPRRFISAMASSFVMNGHKGPQPHRLITAQWLFYLLCMATQALSHTGWLQHNCTVVGRAWICKQEREVRRLQQSWVKTTCIVFYNNISAGDTSLLQVYRCYWTYVPITMLYRWRMSQ